MALHDFDYLDVEDLNPHQLKQFLKGLLSHLELEPVITRERAGHTEASKRKSLQFMDPSHEVVSDIYQDISGKT